MEEKSKRVDVQACMPTRRNGAERTKALHELSENSVQINQGGEKSRKPRALRARYKGRWIAPAAQRQTPCMGINKQIFRIESILAFYANRLSVVLTHCGFVECVPFNRKNEIRHWRTHHNCRPPRLTLVVSSGVIS